MFSRNLVKCVISRSYSSSSTITAAKRTIRQTADKVKEDIITKTLKGRLIKSLEEWNVIRQEILQHKTHITTQNIDAIILGFYTTAENYHMAEKYIEFLKSQGLKMNLATVGKYFRLNSLLYKKKLVPKCKEMELLETYENLRKTYPILDSTTLTNLIEGLSVTSHWQLCLDLLNEVKLNGEPGAAAYNGVISCLLTNNEDILAWKLLQEMIEKEQKPSTSCLTAYIEHIRRNYHKQKDIIAAFEKLFNLFQQNDIRCDQELLTELSNALNGFKFEANFSKVSIRGQCKLCKTNLTKFALSANEFDTLKKTILEKVIVGKDIFNRSTPEELQRFNDFIAQDKRYDVVIDGLNVAYTVGANHNPKLLLKRLAIVAHHFKQQNKTILILGRQHMTRWPNFNYLENDVDVFLTQNVSYDDPYLLYCALNSGKNTIVVSRDLMRQHKFLLKHHYLKIKFNRWLSQRLYQLMYVDSKTGKVVFKEPRPFTQSAQKINDYWHIPLDSDVDENSDWKTKSGDTSWLCIKLS